MAASQDSDCLDSKANYITCKTCGLFKRRGHRRLCVDCRNAWKKQHRAKPEIRAANAAYNKAYRERHPTLTPMPVVLRRLLRHYRVQCVKRNIQARQEQRRQEAAEYAADPWRQWTIKARQQIIKANERRTGWKKWASNKANSAKQERTRKPDAPRKVFRKRLVRARPRWQEVNKRWLAAFRLNGKLHTLGLFITERLAREVLDHAINKHSHCLDEWIHWAQYQKEIASRQVSNNAADEWRKWACSKRSLLFRKIRGGCNMKVTATELLAIINQQDKRCALSGMELTPETAFIDHVVPIKRGGPNTKENIQVLHETVNKMKHTMTNEEFIAMCRQVAAQGRLC